MATPPHNPNVTLSRVDAVMAPRFPRRFRTRVFLYILTLSIGTSLASAGIYYWRQLGFVERDRARRANTLLTSLATQAELGAYAGDASLCELAARRTFSEEDVVLVAVYDRRGRQIILYSHVDIAPPAPPPEVFSRFTVVEGGPLVLRTTRTPGDTYEDLYAPIFTLTRSSADAIASGPGGPPAQRELVGVARVGLSLQPGREQLREMLRWGLILGLAILSVGILAALLISRRVSRPIAALTDGADRIRAGDLDTRVRIESKDEMGQLAYSFNRMARRLNESITALETLNRDLEVEVARRTAEVQRAADFSALLNSPLGQRPPHEAGARDRRVGGAAEGLLAQLLDEALTALIDGTSAVAGAVLLPDEQAAPATSEGLDHSETPPPMELCLARYQGADPADFGDVPPLEFLHFGNPFRDGDRTIVPLIVGELVQGCVVLLDMPPRDDLIRFLAQAASQLGIVVSNVRAYAAADTLARALQERNVALARQRDQLREMNRLKSEFLANVSHELRTPLNAIIGYCELITDGIYGDVNDPQKEALSGIDESGKNLLSLINQILDLAKVESGKMVVHLEEVDVEDVGRAVVAEAAGLTRDRPYKVRLFAGPHPHIRTDGPKIKQIVTNLVSNAVKFTAEGSVDVTIAGEAGGGCSIAVKDTGIGIRAADLHIIFEEFRQVDGSYTRQFGGTGLGLAIARRFAHMLGGDIRVTSAPGVGSTFTLHLPAAAPERTNRSLATPTSTAAASSSLLRAAITLPPTPPSTRVALRPNLKPTPPATTAAPLAATPPATRTRRS